MIILQTFKNTRTLPIESKVNTSSELSRVFAAAVINRQFCEMLLRDPQRALQNGYLGERFLLSKEEQDLLISLRANSLSDLARQISRVLRN